MGMVRRLLDLAGIGGERLHLQWVSSAEAQRFVDIARNAVESVRELGPLDRSGLQMEIEACAMTLNGETLRWLVGKEVRITSKGDVYGRLWAVEKYESVLNNMLEREYQKNLIYLAVKEGRSSVRDISSRTGLGLKRVSYLLADLEKTKRVEFKGMKDRKPMFAAL
ncbi:MAG: hypothetical protein CVU64_12325 [Deltaproteobacteria bacterium HGW-Deltaproteobacteria-21]|nr:MAG: hypothetical protein CVU64_12325 [Deltaproteobacteria bacterium HGW-Deltaproteobacteria-21]